MPRLKQLITLIVLWGGLLLPAMATTAEAPPRQLSSSDVVQARQQALAQTLAVNGLLEATQSAVLYAQVEAVAKQVRKQTGETVSAGESLVVFEARELQEKVREQQALLATTEARWQLAQQKLLKQQELYQRQFISHLALEEFQAELAVQRAQRQAQRAQLQRAQQELSYAEVKAPFAGVIAERHIEVGQLAARNSKLFHVVNLDHLQWKVTVPAQHIAGVKVGQHAELRVEGDSRRYQGQVERINPVAIAGNRSFQVYVAVENRHHHLRVGQLARGELVLAQAAPAVVLPLSAIRQRQGEQGWVLRVRQGKAEKQAVKLGFTNQQWAQVEGIAAGEWVILPQVLGIAPATPVRLPQP